MKIALASLALAAGLGLALSPAASAAPASPAVGQILAHGSVRIGIGTGYGYDRGYSSGGYYTTEYRWVQQVVLVGYDRYRNPVYETRWYQQPFQVWVPATYAYPRRSSGFSVGFGYRWR